MKSIVITFISIMMLTPNLYAEGLQGNRRSETAQTGLVGALLGSLSLVSVAVIEGSDKKASEKLAEILRNPAPITEANIDKFKGHTMIYKFKNANGDIVEEKFVVKDLKDMNRFEKQRRKLSASSRKTIKVRSHAGGKIVKLGYVLGTAFIAVGGATAAAAPAPEASYIEYQDIEVAE